MRGVNETASFKRDMKRVARSGRYSVSELLTVVHALAEDIPLDPKYRDHALTGTWRDQLCLFSHCQSRSTGLSSGE